MADTLGHGEGGGHLVGGEGEQLQRAVLAARGDVRVAVVDGEGAHPGPQAEALAQLLPAEVVHVHSGLRADYQALLRRPATTQLKARPLCRQTRLPRKMY